MTSATPLSYLLGSYFLFGIGDGMMTAPITSAAVAGMPAAQAGVASAVASTSRQVGMTLGVAVIGAVCGGSLAGGIGTGVASATHPGWWIIGGLAAVTLAFALTSTGRWADATARRTAARLGQGSCLATRRLAKEQNR